MPRERFTVITGVSGSGKSTLAFDILFHEGQRRYLESLNAFARQFVQPAARPDVDSITGLPPTVAIEQRASRGGLKSTVATLTEIYHFLRLDVREAGGAVLPGLQRRHRAAEPGAHRDADCERAQRGRRIQLLAPLIAQRKGIYTDLARWAAARGVRGNCGSTARSCRPSPSRASSASSSTASRCRWPRSRSAAARPVNCAPRWPRPSRQETASRTCSMTGAA